MYILFKKYLMDQSKNVDTVTYLFPKKCDNFFEMGSA